ncbi:MAG: hypothetical protein LLF98_11130 [Clostridium sp.]|uniref:hypothetical protein n=1 Tax=Clostridium sp. TaxID=1506 RepID=UPI0025BCB8A9|nr:hypothetical protein [Clostridium sp.]MCE5221782.1 hypothetical protein [Clostridium sp.]
MMENNNMYSKEGIDVLLKRIKEMKFVIDDYRMILAQLAISCGWDNEQIGNVIGVDSETIEHLK